MCADIPMQASGDSYQDGMVTLKGSLGEMDIRFEHPFRPERDALPLNRDSILRSLFSALEQFRLIANDLGGEQPEQFSS